MQNDNANQSLALAPVKNQQPADIMSKATEMKLSAYHEALCALGLSEAVGDISDHDFAQASELTLRSLVDTGMSADVATLSYADEIRREGIWRFLGMDSWAEFVEAALPESGDKKWRSILNNYWRVIDMMPEQIETEAGIIDKQWLLANPSKLQDMIPAVSGIDVEKSEGRTQFNDIVKVAAAQTREGLRNYLRASGLRESKMPEIACPKSVTRTVDATTGEVTRQVHFEINVDERIARWLEKRLAPVITFQEARA